MSIGNKKCYSDLFKNNILIISSTKTKMKSLIRKIFNWSNKNEISLGINKSVTMVINPLNIVNYYGYENLIIKFNLDIKSKT